MKYFPQQKPSNAARSQCLDRCRYALRKLSYRRKYNRQKCAHIDERRRSGSYKIRRRTEIVSNLSNRLVDEEIPVMAHIGLTPQSVHKLGGYSVQGKTAEDAKRLIEDAKMLEEAGAFAIVLELVPREIAEIITNELKISTVGIGAGTECDIQVLVLHDLVGMSFGRLPRFVRQYANIREVMIEAITNWI